MKVLVTGERGQLGRTLLAKAPPDLALTGIDRSRLDITDRGQVLAAVEREKPGVIVNCASYNAVDLAESAVAEARKVNATGPQNLALAAHECGSRLIHVSTDFVFDGLANEAYSPDAQAHPQSAYGASKWEGEQLVRQALPEGSIILRTSWLYSEYGGNFVSTMLRLFRERDEITVVDDQVGSPTWARSVADVIFAFIAQPELVGTYHWTDSGQTSWYDFACAIQEEAIELGQIDKTIGIKPISSKDYQAAAPRPAYSVLDCSATATELGLEQTPWRQNLRRMLEVNSQ